MAADNVSDKYCIKEPVVEQEEYTLASLVASLRPLHFQVFQLMLYVVESDDKS